jgi:hypothetical protein
MQSSGCQAPRGNGDRPSKLSHPASAFRCAASDASRFLAASASRSALSRAMVRSAERRSFRLCFDDSCFAAVMTWPSYRSMVTLKCIANCVAKGGPFPCRSSRAGQLRPMQQQSPPFKGDYVVDKPWRIGLELALSLFDEGSECPRTRPAQYSAANVT